MSVSTFGSSTSTPERILISVTSAACASLSISSTARGRLSSAITYRIWKSTAARLARRASIRSNATHTGLVILQQQLSKEFRNFVKECLKFAKIVDFAADDLSSKLHSGFDTQVENVGV